MRISDWSSDVCSSDLVEGKDVGGLAGPAQRLAAGARLKTGQAGNGAARRVLAGQPFGIEQGQRAGLLDRDRLVDVKDAARDVGGVDLQRQRARIRTAERRGGKGGGSSG